MPEKSVKKRESRFIFAFAGNGPAMDMLDEIFQRDDFIRAFPHIKIAGWIPELDNKQNIDEVEKPGFLAKYPVFKSVRQLFSARTGINVIIDISEDSRFSEKIRSAAPEWVSICTAESVVQFCQSARDGRLAIAGGEGIRKAQNLFNLLMNQMEDEVFLLDSQGKIINLNNFAAQKSDRSVEQCIGKNFDELNPELHDHDEDSSCAFCRARATGKKTETLLTVVNDGRVQYLNTFCFPIADEPDGVPRQYLYILRDVTERKQMEQRLQKNEKMAAIGELSTYMAHEIRNPLFSIGGFANALLRNASLDEQGREKARIIYEESRRLDTILTNILNFARPTQQEIDEFTIEPVIRQTVNLLLMGSDERGISLNFDVDASLPKVVGNIENFKQCLINLVKNAIEAIPEGGEITVRGRRGGENVLVHVEDNGVGISPELGEQIFSPFFSTKHEGTGLGLAMARKIITDMGGKLTFVSKVGEGSTFTIELPAALDIQ